MLVQILFISFALYQEFIEDQQVVETVPGSLIRFRPDFLVADSFQRLFGSFGIIPEISGRS
jgi:hypothetical protein